MDDVEKHKENEQGVAGTSTHEKNGNYLCNCEKIFLTL